MEGASSNGRKLVWEWERGVRTHPTGWAALVFSAFFTCGTVVRDLAHVLLDWPHPRGWAYLWASVMTVFWFAYARYRTRSTRHLVG
jgi:hypothetical protein